MGRDHATWLRKRHHAAYRNGGKIYRTRVLFTKTYEGLP